MFFLIRNQVLAKTKKIRILHTKWYESLEILGFINLSNPLGHIID